MRFSKVLLFEEGFNNFAHGDGCGGIGEVLHKGLASVSGFDDFRVDGDRAEEGDFHTFGDTLAATATENLSYFTATGADEAAHVLDDADDRYAHLLAEVYRFADIDGRDALGGGDYYSTVEAGREGGEELANRERFVASAGGRVDDKEI